jgi:hypothetical protein
VKEKLPHPPMVVAPAPPPAVVLEEAPSSETTLRLGVHDLSRIEWTARLPLPERGVSHYEINFDVDIPANLYSPINMWDYVQQFTRLQSPDDSGALQIERGDLDELRRDVLGVAHRLKVLRERFERTALGAASLMVEALHPSLAANLMTMLEQAMQVTRELRSLLQREPTDAGQGRPSPVVQRECELADEWISHQLLDFLAAAQRALDAMLLGPHSRLRELNVEWPEELSSRLAEALADEVRYRRDRGLLNPRPDSPQELSAFVERGSHLKKHFQDVLFLDVSSIQVDYRVRNWTGIAAASIAAVFWLGFTLIPFGPGAKAGIGMFVFAAAFAAAYALKDRMKELTRFWLAGRLTQLYGQRAVTLRMPQRADPERRTVLEARESFHLHTIQAEDALNTTVQATRRVMRIRYTMRADVHSCPRLNRSGIHSLKHIFRWDLTPIFSRLDNAVKAVPVLDPVTRRVRFVDAPKEYRLAVRLAAEAGSQSKRVEVQMVISKRGLERLENFAES